MVQNPHAMQEIQVRSLGQEDPLEKETATHSSILAWRIQWTEEPDGLQSMGLHRVGCDSATKQIPPPPVFIAALFTIARTWKQPKCSSTDEWVEMWYTYTGGYYSAIKKNEGLPWWSNS